MISNPQQKGSPPSRPSPSSPGKMERQRERDLHLSKINLKIHPPPSTGSIVQHVRRGESWGVGVDKDILQKNMILSAPLSSAMAVKNRWKKIRIRRGSVLRRGGGEQSHPWIWAPGLGDKTHLVRQRRRARAPDVQPDRRLCFVRKAFPQAEQFKAVDEALPDRIRKLGRERLLRIGDKQFPVLGREETQKKVRCRSSSSSRLRDELRIAVSRDLWAAVADDDHDFNCSNGTKSIGGMQ